MSFSFDGPFASATRPPHVEPASPGNWAKDPSGVGATDGTRVTASLINEIVANLRGLVTGAGLPLLPGNDVNADTMVLRAVQALVDSTFALVAPGQNLLINGDMAINQRLFAGGALSAAAYGYDRWEADTGGCTVSRAIVASLPTITLTSGTVMQVVEAAVWGRLSGLQVALSVDTLVGGSLNVTVGTQTGVITPGPGRRGVVLTLGAGETGNINVKLAPAGAAVNFQQVKLERGGQVTPWVPRAAAIELMLCQRYYWKSYALATAPGTVTTSGQLSHLDHGATTTKILFGRIYPVAMRTTPTRTWYSPATGTAGQIRNVTSAADQAVVSAVLGTETWTGTVNTDSAGGSGHEWSGHLVAEAEL